jgi:dTDP-glucose pyrophosphorylase
MLNIVVPMAGAGKRFATAGYADPKPLIKVHGVPMIKLVVDNLKIRGAHRFIFVCQKAHVEAYDLGKVLSEWAPGAVVVTVDGLTAGAAVTVLAARAHIDNDDMLTIANSDQWVDASIDAYHESLAQEDLDGLIMTMRATDPKWSFVALSGTGLVTRVVEKEPISDEATVGIYTFRRGRDFVRAADRMIAKDLRVNGEFYVAPVYNELIGEGAKIGIHNIGSDLTGMYGLGIPADLERFLALDISLTAADPGRLARARAAAR